MRRRWDKLAGEQGEELADGRLKRFARMGKLGVSVGTGAAIQRVGSLFRKGEARDRADAEFLEKQAEKVTRVLGQMKGATMKLGQILSSDPELLPPQFTEALTALQSEAPPMTWTTVSEVIEDAFDRPVSDIFAWFDPEPIGAASIGQVHQGRLHSGESVAVKIQYPGITKTLDADIKNLGTMMQMMRVVFEKKRLDEYLHEVRSAILAEADYESECSNLEHFHQVLADRPGVRAPRAFPEYTRETVLTMELVDGQKLDDAVDKLPPDQKNALLYRFVDTYAWMLHDRYELHADPHPGNFILEDDGTMVMLDFGCIKKAPKALADGVLDILDACWQNDHERVARIYRSIGFGGENPSPSVLNANMLRAYHEIALEPFMVNREFNFSEWDMRKRLQSFIADYPAFLKLAPPAESVLVFRTLGGIKGFLVRCDGKVNVHRMAVECARRNGRLSAEPSLSA
jgi:predicted unusual protein kinase regulating ubiquinone biosynthesis (AarF/ABC1/UbiB family)